MYGNRVVVTGMGTITPIGTTVPRFWAACLQGMNGVRLITRFDASGLDCKIAAEITDFDPLSYFDRKEAKRTDRYAQYALIATEEAIQNSNLLFNGLNRDRVGVIMASGIGGIETIAREHRELLNKGPGRISALFVPMIICDIAAGLIAIRHKFGGPNYSTVSACASSQHAIGEAACIIARGDADAMIAGGAEAAITPLGMGGFDSMKALSTRNDAPDKASRPFDKDRDGFVMGEGAGVIVLESLGHAEKRGARIFAEICGYAATADGYHITSPDPEGRGAVRSMALAIENAHLSPSEIGYVNAHGTSTPHNDRTETLAIKTVFGSDRPPVSSTKSMTGHLLGAAGGVEMIATINALSESILPPTRNYENPDPECDLDYIPVARPQNVEFGLSNAFGFGGHNASIVVGAWHGENTRKAW